ncbi:MAG TPA: UvrD-helicase domain-containing protein [Lacipirellulaceae bacterium]|jgi:DNA helicase-2/ATP-dependent DNA helicase PcrA|nr:UvrD-helicase domain-containing protein [Lacipirellulaceae bacterium]
MNRLLESLTEPQRDAVTHREGALLVLAGPGSGKTRVITHRIAHLIESGVPSSEILALTFTNKAADEMQRRVAELSPGSQVWLSTFHRFGAMLLRRYAEYVGLQQNFTIYDTSDARQTIKRVIEAREINTLNYSADRLHEAISAAKNKLITADKYEPRIGSMLSRVVAEVYPAYQARLLASSAVDFDDLLLHVAQLLYEHAEVRAELDERYRYVMVDEYQDTNRAQYVVLRALSTDHPNLAVTGDPDQSIYGWRGADLNNILEFEHDYPNVKIVRLERNYRSTKRILHVADELIGHNLRRKKKELWTENGEGAAVRLVAYLDQDKEAADIAEQIRAAVAEGKRKPSDFAVFYRVNALSRSLERALRAAGVPYQMIRGQEFYARKEIKDVLGYCQLINNPRDDMAFERTINTPVRGIGRKTIERLTEHAYRHGIPLLEAARAAWEIEGFSKGTAAKVAAYVEIIDRITAVVHGDVEEVIGTVLEASGYRATLAESDDEQDQNRLANIEELLTDARQFDEQNPGGGKLEEYLERSWLVNETDNFDTQTDKATLMTLHAAKGLEFPVVFIVAVEDGVLPHERVGQHPDELEEERRLAFVGITRAKEELQLSYAVTRDFRGVRRRTIPSSFLMEMPRGEMEMLGSAEAFDAVSFDPWDVPDDDEGDDSWDWQLEDAAASKAGDQNNQSEVGSSPAINIAAASIKTAATLSREMSAGEEARTAEELPRVSPDLFRQGMTVTHPEYGPGKVVALSGSGKNRRATIQFATVGEKKIILAHSAVRPVR